MEAGVQASFIPQEADVLISDDNRYNRSDGLSDLLLLFAIVLFVASIGLGVGVFLYQQVLGNEIASKTVSLSKAKDAFDPSTIQQFIRLDDRMIAADKILSSHIAPIVIFEALNQATLSTVSFNSISIDANDPKAISATLSGTARSVNSVALQDDIFSKNSVVTGPIFSGIARSADGVHFNLKLMVNYNQLSYEKIVSPQQAAPAVAPAPSGNTGSPFSAPQGATQ